MRAADLRAALAARPAVEHPPMPGRRNHRRAGVLVPLVWDPEPVVVLTLRAAHLGRHAGEVSFPGGKPEPDDLDLQATALREAREELGITDAAILGRLSSMPLYPSDYRLEPFVAEIPPAPLRPDPGDVARVLRVPLAAALAAPAIEAIPYQLPGQAVRMSPVFRPEGEVMFGATAHTFYELLQVAAAAWSRPLPPLVESDLDWQDLLR